MDCTSPVLGIYPCGKCINCRARSRQEWVFRLRMEYQSCNFGLFVTLTYADEYLPPDGVSVRDIQLFIKRLRKHFNSKSLRYFIVSEYGDHTQREHYHALLFFSIAWNDDIYDIITSSWKNGFTQFGDIEEGSIVYCTKYCLKGSDVPPGKNDNFRLVSKMDGGIGVDYIEKQSEYHKDLSKPSLVRWQGEQAPMPRYYREKMLRKYDENDKVNIRLAYQDYLRDYRADRTDKEIKKYANKHKIKDSLDAEKQYYCWRSECNERKAELNYKRTKKQNLW